MERVDAVALEPVVHQDGHLTLVVAQANTGCNFKIQIIRIEEESQDLKWREDGGKIKGMN